MKYCSKCGTELRDEVRFCSKCGTPCKIRPDLPAGASADGIQKMTGAEKSGSETGNYLKHRGTRRSGRIIPVIAAIMGILVVVVIGVCGFLFISYSTDLKIPDRNPAAESVEHIKGKKDSKVETTEEAEGTNETETASAETSASEETSEITVADFAGSYTNGRGIWDITEVDDETVKVEHSWSSSAAEWEEAYGTGHVQDGVLCVEMKYTDYHGDASFELPVCTDIVKMASSLPDDYAVSDNETILVREDKTEAGSYIGELSELGDKTGYIVWTSNEDRSAEAEYIFWYSAQAPLEDFEVSQLDKNGLKIARNEIFARHGYKFKSEELQNYFNSRSWYQGTIDQGNFNFETMLSDVEKKNIKLIESFEEKQVAEIDHAEATSCLSENGTKHSPDRICDQSLERAWVEGAQGQGIGEAVTIFFRRTCSLSKMIINAGYQKSEDLYYKNSRPHTLRLHYSDGNTESVELSDVDQAQEIALSYTGLTDYVSVEIESVYAGSKYEDTVISEIHFE